MPQENKNPEPDSDNVYGRPSQGVSAEDLARLLMGLEQGDAALLGALRNIWSKSRPPETPETK